MFSVQFKFQASHLVMDYLAVQTPSICQLFLKIDPKENFPALFCHPIADESAFICRQRVGWLGWGNGGAGGGGVRRNCRKKSLMGKSTIKYSCALSSMYIISQCTKKFIKPEIKWLSCGGGGGGAQERSRRLEDLKWSAQLRWARGTEESQLRAHVNSKNEDEALIFHLFCSSSRRQTPCTYRDGTLVPSFLYTV